MTKQVELSEVTQTLVRARELLEKGWCQNTLRDGDSYCMSGAIWYAGGGVEGIINDDIRERLAPVYRIVSSVLNNGSPMGDLRAAGWSVPWWNDRLGRTKEEVLAAMDKAIAISMGVPELTL